jgi:hypothetical protein
MGAPSSAYDAISSLGNTMEGHWPIRVATATVADELNQYGELGQFIDYA